MLEKIIDLFGSKTATFIGGAFLVLSFILSNFGVETVIDPAWVAVIFSGLPLLRLAVRRLIYNKGIAKISSALLISVAMISAICIGDLFAAGEVAFIMAIGEILEDMTTARAKRGLKKLMSLAPTHGRKITDGKEQMIPAEDIRKGDILRILPGETVPVDGVIISGETSVDQSVMTGEALPVDKACGDTVFCGTINRFGAVDIEAQKVGEDSSLQKLIGMVKSAEEKKSPIARLADKSASILVPVALLIAVIAGFVTGDIVRAVTVLVVFCPCALVLATPTAIMAAIGQATKHGVIIKKGEALELMGRVDTVAFDKTGTITHGSLEVCDIVPFDGLEGEELLRIAASVESRSEHPLGRAIYELAENQGVSLSEITDFEMTAGRGVAAKIGGETVFCGNEKYIEGTPASLDAEKSGTIEALHQQGKATVIVAKGAAVLGVIALSDVLRKDAKYTVERLKDMKTETVLLTGDHIAAAGYFAKQAGISEVHAALMPAQKVERIAAMMEEGRMVCMVGDGVNDAPALKTASVGVAMGGMGSDIAVEAADIALMSDDISKLPYLKRLSVATVNTIKFSIALSLLINIVAVVLSVMGVLGPTTGALVHNAGSCFVVLIAALLYDRKFDK